MIVPFSIAFFFDSQIFAKSSALIKIQVNIKIYTFKIQLKNKNVLALNNKCKFRNDLQIMNINELQFVSHRDSIASEFVSQTANNSSLLSSRRAFDDSVENDLEDFKEQIQYKFIRSVANKIYTYPLSQQGFDLANDEEEFSDLVDVEEYNLFSQVHQIQDGFKKQQYKIKNKKVGSKTANLLLQTLKSQRQRISHLRTAISESLETKKNSKLGGMLYLNIDDQSNREYTQQDCQMDHNYRKKRLNTQPYQKPMGFIIKKK